MTELTNRRKQIGWWITTTPTGEEWASNRYEGETIEDAQREAIATFGEGSTVRKG